MRKDDSGSRLTPTNSFNLDRINQINNFETGNTATLGFNYDVKEKNIDKFNFSVAKIISEKENKKISTKTGLDEKLSDFFCLIFLGVWRKDTLIINFNQSPKAPFQFSID